MKGWYKVTGNSTGSEVYPIVGERVFCFGEVEKVNGYETNIFITKRGSTLTLRMCDVVKDVSKQYGFNSFLKDLFRFRKW